ncbi:hypothetical protein P3X46_029932 [Hevea brasiliensis]|uniref:Uncharacterized protein n=1 Tax=Hevea brasiliensis TaxID=3981 RepID=A0ABQ9KVW4_HEVBR|nr:hypothetical protein P3X46_029932 [Hevea brasiliensis]
MSAVSPQPLARSLVLPCQPGQSVEIVAATGVSDSDSGEYMNAIDSSLLKLWLKNLQSETGILANGCFSLKRVLVQGEWICSDRYWLFRIQGRYF